MPTKSMATTTGLTRSLGVRSPATSGSTKSGTTSPSSKAAPLATESDYRSNPQGRTALHKLVQDTQPRPNSDTASTNPEARPSPFCAAPIRPGSRGTCDPVAGGRSNLQNRGSITPRPLLTPRQRSRAPGPAAPPALEQKNRKPYTMAIENKARPASSGRSSSHRRPAAAVAFARRNTGQAEAKRGLPGRRYSRRVLRGPTLKPIPSRKLRELA